MTGFNERVLTWLQERGGYPEATSIEAVEPYGSDWNGDTENGFYSTFSVSITFTYGEDKRGHRDVEGLEMQTLWSAVVS